MYACILRHAGGCLNQSLTSRSWSLLPYLLSHSLLYISRLMTCQGPTDAPGCPHIISRIPSMSLPFTGLPSTANHCWPSCTWPNAVPCPRPESVKTLTSPRGLGQQHWEYIDARTLLHFEMNTFPVTSSFSNESPTPPCVTLRWILTEVILLR